MQTDTGTALCLSAFRGSCIRTILAAFSFLFGRPVFPAIQQLFPEDPCAIIPSLLPQRGVNTHISGEAPKGGPKV